MASPYETFDWENAGVQQVMSVVNAAAATGLELDSFTVIETTHRLWDCCSEQDLANLHALVRPL